ncbi:MAG: 50S ribosomal protein L24 [Planctomycetes bacterium]|nr:50S ribosomal protein L24 [Planctomycetota bacterium]
MPRHVRKGDMVLVRAGNQRGTVAEVLAVIPDDNRVIVKGVNVRTHHLKKTQARPQGGLLKQEAPIHMSNVSPVVDGKPTRVRFQTKSDGSKVRVAARTGKELHTLHAPSKKK